LLITTTTAATAADVLGQETRTQLQRAIDVSRELAGKAEAPDTPELKKAAETMSRADAGLMLVQAEVHPQTFASDSHVAALIDAAPWLVHYWRLDDRRRLIAPSRNWRVPLDRHQLRASLLSDDDPAMRAMAATALAVRHEPDDVARIAGLLDDKAAAAPHLGWNSQMISSPILPGWQPPTGDRLNLQRSWYDQTVGEAAKRALWLMTGKRFDDRAAFGQWWKANHIGRHALWYWQQRIERQMGEANLATGWPRVGQWPDEPWQQFHQRRSVWHEALRNEVHRAIVAELAELPPEVEAKVRLLTQSEHAGGAPITGSETQFWPAPPRIRLSRQRLLDLLDRKDLWADVAWDDPSSGPYNLLAERMGMWADVLFEREDVPRLRAVYERERDNLWWSGQAALLIGISRLLPAAEPGVLDSLDTRDGVLRKAAWKHQDLFVSDYCARELVRVGLPANAPFLIDLAFHPVEGDRDNRTAQGILQALAQPPLTNEKRQLLIDLLLDERFENYWTRRNSEMGMDMCRQYGMWAVNAHAGRELIDHTLMQRLVSDSAAALAEVKKRVQTLRD
jgi:hypothetical protein